MVVAVACHRRCLDLVQPVEVEPEQPAREAVDEQQVVARVRELLRAGLPPVETALKVGDVSRSAPRPASLASEPTRSAISSRRRNEYRLCANSGSIVYSFPHVPLCRVQRCLAS